MGTTEMISYTAAPAAPYSLRCIAHYAKADLASVHVLAFGGDPRRVVEAVESVQPGVPRNDKWVLIVSTHFGCPVGCAMCDAAIPSGHARSARGLDAPQILAQVDHLVASRFPERHLPQRKLKVQFARMGEPTLNRAVLDVLRALPQHLAAPGLMPCVSTVAPVGRDAFFDELTSIKRELYGGGRFQMQFSVHTTDPVARRALVPIRCWDLRAIGRFGERFHEPADRKIGLNFAACADHPIEPERVAEHCDPARFVVKLTPLNPTTSVRRGALRSWIDGNRPESARPLVDAFARLGFEVIVSIGALEENAIGSNCGQLVTELRAGALAIRDGYRSAAYRAEDACGRAEHLGS